MVEGRQPAKRLSMNDRLHWAPKAKIEQEWIRSVWAHANEVPKPEIVGLATVQIDFGVTDPLRRRDPHNLAPTQKVIIDSLTLAKGFWIDDDFTRVTVPEARYYKATVPTYRITITWEEPDE